MSESNQQKNARVYRLAYVVTHPIQYQSPMLRLLSDDPRVELEVFFLSDFSLLNYVDAEFGVNVDWGIPLTEGFSSQFVKSTFQQTEVSFFNPRPSITDLYRRLNAQKWDAIWVNGYANTGLLAALLYARFKKIPMLIRNDSNPYNKPASWKKNFINRWLVRNAHGLLYCGSANKQHYLGYGAQANQLFSVPFAVDNVFFQSTPRQKTEITALREEQDIVFLFAAKMTQRKNARLLMQAYAQLPTDLRGQARIVFIGDGPDRESMELEAQALDLSNRVHFLGFKNQMELPSYYFDCDVFVLPSANEPFAVAVNEAMNAGKPLILADEVGAHYDLLQPTVNGWLVKTGDVDSLNHALAQAIEHRSKLKAMGQASLEIIEHWDFKADVAGIVESLSAI